jgi:menaquinone-dependent protoporphyrinogen oxidase
MTRKILVAYATKLEATIDVAQTIGETIAQNGFKVDVKHVKHVTDITAYDGVVLGSAIRMGQWLPEAVEFAKRHQDYLDKVPVAIFTVHILNLGDDPESQKERMAYTAPVMKMLTPKAEAFFAGKIDPAQLSFFERLLFKAVKSPAGDFRDWDRIRCWATDVFQLILES